MNKEGVKKYKNYLDGLKSSTNLDERDVNAWCDLIELLCYTNDDKLIFREDIERELEKFVDGGIQLAALSEISVQMGYDIDDTHIFSNQGNVDWGSDESAKNDLLSQITNIWFSHLQLRQKEFGDYYPFQIKNDNSEISCKRFYRLNKKNKLYLYFLLTSKRNGLEKAQQTRLELDFEPIAFEAFKSLLPLNGEAHLMGKGSYTSPQFRKNKYNKFKFLSDILKVKMKVTENYFSPKDSGENGIDFIGWLSFDDELPNNMIFAGQATCMDSWSEKEYDSSINRGFAPILDASKIGAYINSLFIPFHFKVGNNWAYPTKVEARQYILFDRFRILNAINIAKIKGNLIPQVILRAIAA